MAQARTLTASDLRTVLDYTATRQHATRNRLLLLMGHWAGMRCGEISALKWATVVDANGQVKTELRLTAEQTKGNEGRTVFINERLRRELQAYVAEVGVREANTAFFYTQKQPQRGFTANTLAQHLLHIYKGAGIEGASSHSGRRSFASGLGAKGISVRVLMRALGHKDIGTTIKYIDASDDLVRNAVALVA